ncbi:MAG: MarR family transcriptional regulator [Casimicrobiaceae bacterium]
MDDSDTPSSAAAPLTPLARRFVLHWGEMGSRWGVNRTVAQIHALLYFQGQPMHAEAIADALQVARSNVSNSLRELINWNLIRVTHSLGDRRDHFETARDPWELFRTIVRERKAREFEPTIGELRRCLEDPGFSRLDALAQARLRETLGLMESLSEWTDEMLALETKTLKKLLKLGAKVRKLLRDDAKPLPNAGAAAARR